MEKLLQKVKQPLKAKSLKIAFIGQKGIPGQWGGVEAHVDELAYELTKKGHQVYVYVRNWYTSKSLKEHKGSKLIHTPTLKTKHLDAFIHSFTSSLHALSKNFDIIHYHAIGPAFFSWIPRLKSKIVCTIHRYDYEAEKWGVAAKMFLRFSEKIALSVPHKTIVVAKYQQEFYQRAGKRVEYVPNGVRIPSLVKPDQITAKYGLKGNDYILFLGRLVPEKRPDWLIKAYLKSKEKVGHLKLVIAGGSSATDSYSRKLKKLAQNDENIIFTDYVQGQLKEELLSNAKLFVIPSELEGLPIALLEAMSYGLTCLASDIPAHCEVVKEGENGFLFHKQEFKDFAQKLIGLTKFKQTSVGEKAKQSIKKEYDWSKIAANIEQIYLSLISKR